MALSLGFRQGESVKIYDLEKQCNDPITTIRVQRIIPAPSCARLDVNGMPFTLFNRPESNLFIDENGKPTQDKNAPTTVYLSEPRRAYVHLCFESPRSRYKILRENAEIKWGKV